MPGRLQQVIAQYRIQLLHHEAQAQASLSSAHAHTLQKIQPHLDKLYRQISAAQQSGHPVPLHFLYEQNRLQTIKALISGQINQYGALAKSTTVALKKKGVQLGEQSGLDQLEATLPEQTPYSFGVPSQGAIESIVGSTQKGSPLADLFDGFGAEAAQKVGQVLISAITLGDNPRKIARDVEDALDISRSRALTIARTEMLRAYRESAIETYRANDDVVEGWLWMSALDARTCAVCISMHGTVHSLDEDLDGHPNCIPSGAIVSGPRVVGSSTRWYDGEVVDIETVGGNFLTVTPNHPILTLNGWVAAGELNEGCNVVSSLRRERPSEFISPDDYQIEAPIEQVAASFGGSFAMSSSPMPTSPEDFHGDGIGSKVHIIRSYSHLRDDINALLLQPFLKQQFSWRNAQLFLLSGLSSLDLFIQRMFTPTYSIMGSTSSLTSLFWRHVGSSNNIGLTSSTSFDSSNAQMSSYHSARDIVRIGKSFLGFSRNVSLGDFFGRQRYMIDAQFASLNSASFFNGPKQSSLSQLSSKPLLTGMELLTSILGAFSSYVCLDRVLKVSRRRFSGHVYNLQTINGWYIANNIITHNCRCTKSPRVKGSSFSPLLGSDWFDDQSETVQRQILGSNAAYEAYDSGASLSDFVGVNHDKDWGKSVYQRSAKEIAG